MNKSYAFSLVEVVIATAIVAGSVVAVLGLLAPLSKRTADVVDVDNASRLVSSIEQELHRLGFEFVRDRILNNAPFYLYAPSDGSSVRIGPRPEEEPTSVGDAVNASLAGSGPGGIAKRDRYFLLTLSEQTLNGESFNTERSGSIPLTAVVAWPYRIPVGPGSSLAESGGDPSFDPSQLIPESERRSFVLFFSISR